MGDEPPHLFSGHTVLPEPDFHRLDRASFAWRTQTTLKGTQSGNTLVVCRLDQFGQGLQHIITRIDIPRLVLMPGSLPQLHISSKQQRSVSG